MRRASNTSSSTASAPNCGRPAWNISRQAVGTLVAEESRLGMLVGVAVGFELARTLETKTSTEGD